MLQHMPEASLAEAQGGGSGEGRLLHRRGSARRRRRRELEPGEPASRHRRRAGAGRAGGAADRASGPAVPRGRAAGVRRQGLAFGCSCSAEKVRNSLSIYSAKDIATMTTEAGIVTADCQFCGAHYEFDPTTRGVRGRWTAAASLAERLRRARWPGRRLRRDFDLNPGVPAPEVRLRPAGVLMRCERRAAACS